MILSRLRKGERVDHFETKRVRKDGEVIEISLTISPVRDGAGKIVGASKIARDITVQKRATEALARASAETARQSRMKDEFLATLSHELRTPLQSIVGWLQLLRSESCDSEELAHGLAVVERNVAAQQRIIEDLLDMNRILSGKVRLDVQRVELAPVIQAALDTIRPSADAKAIRIHAVLDPLAKPVSGDPQRLQQIFWNLLSNAVKFTPQRGRIEVLLERVNSHLEVTFADNGIGIADEFLPYVFDRFRQQDGSDTRSQGGLGLGLAIVKHLVELHGGTVLAKSSGLGKGAKFSVILPLAAINDIQGRSTPADDDHPTPSGRPNLKNVSVVVVDDDADSRFLIARTLAKAGAEVRAADSVDEGLSLIDAALPHVIVSDIGMPGRNGYALIEELRSRTPEKGGKIPAIALTAYTRMEDRVKALTAGFQILLPKPAEALELLVTVESMVRR